MSDMTHNIADVLESVDEVRELIDNANRPDDEERDELGIVLASIFGDEFDPEQKKETAEDRICKLMHQLRYELALVTRSDAVQNAVKEATKAGKPANECFFMLGGTVEEKANELAEEIDKYLEFASQQK